MDTTQRGVIKAARRVPGGFTMVEMLVALLALSIGLLGIAGLQLTGLRANLGASLRSQATYLAYDILDRMRANRTNLARYDAVGLGAAPAPGGQATADLAAWKANLTAVLPLGDGTIDVLDRDGDGVIEPEDNEVIVTVQWNDARDSALTPLVFTTRSTL
jgi:type IV pilus assembly protein PilV